MPKPNPKEKQNPKQGVVGKPIKDIIPSSYPHVRDIKEVEYPQQGEKVYTPENLPIELFPEWSSNESDIEAMQKSLLPENEDAPQKYTDPNGDKVYLPLNLFIDFLGASVKWLPPEKYITEIYLDKLIQKQMPKKNPFKFRTKVHECYEEELKIRQRNLEKSAKNNDEVGDKDQNENNNNNNSEESESDIEKKDEFLIYRDFFKVLDAPLNLNIVNSITRMETEEEMNIRIKRQEDELQQQMLNDPKKKKDKKHAAKPQSGPEAPSEKIEITVPAPNDISLKENLPPFSRWVGSIFQIIKDRNLLDVKTGESIWQKIYPQKNGVPLYNKRGHYVVKLYHMGRARKVEIDDRMPVSQNDEYFLPKCESLEEIWPAILTKALLKLYSYKLVSNKYFEIGDAEPFYALTGYIPASIRYLSTSSTDDMKIKDMDSHNESKIIEIESKNSKSSNINNNKDNKDDDNNKIIDNNNINNNNEQQIKNELNAEQNNNNGINENQNENINEQQEVPKEKINFLEKALIDENYTNSNYLVECFKSIDKNFYKIKTDLNVFDEESEDQLIKDMHLLDNPPTQQIENQQPKKIEDDNNKDKDVLNNIPVMEYGPIPEEDDNKPGRVSIEINKQNLLNTLNPNTNANAKYSLTMGKMSSDYSMTDWNKAEFKRIHDKLEDYSMQNNLHKGILYDIVDIFDNREYNMNRLQPIDFSDLKAMLKNFNKNNVFKQLNRDEKKLYITNLKDIKEKQKLAKAQRIESLKLKGPQYYSVKIENKGIEKPSCVPQHDGQEIQMAKKCLLNHWEFPPMEYLDQRYSEKKALEKERQEAEEEAENAQKKKKRGDKEKQQKKNEHIEKEKEKDKDNKDNKDENKQTRTWSKEIYLQLINNNLEQFKESKSPIVRGDGYWIESNIFFNSFDNFLVLYNPSKYNTCFDWENYWENTSDILTPKDENEVLYFKPNANKSETEENKKTNNLCNYLVMMYETISDNNNKLRNLPYKIRFRFLQKDEKVDQGKIIKIDSFYGSEYIDGLSEDSEYFLIFEGGIYPEGFYLKVISDYSITPLSYQNFLASHQGFNKQTFHVEHNALQKNELYVLLRVSIINEARSKFMIISNNTKDKYANEFIKIYVCEHNNRNSKKSIEFKSFFELNPGEYMLVMTIAPIYILDANSYDVDIMSCSDLCSSGMDVSQTNTAIPGEQNKTLGLTLEQVESVAPYEISDIFHPNKKFILFKEFIFAGDKVNALLYIKKTTTNKNENKEDDSANQQETKETPNDHNNKKQNKNVNPNTNNNNNNTKSNNNNNNNNNNNADISNSANDLAEQNVNATNNNNNNNKEEDMVRLKLQLYSRENELMYEEDFYNEIILHNMIFEGNPVAEAGAGGAGKGGKKSEKKNIQSDNTNSSPSNLPYRLICTIDTSESPNKYSNPSYVKSLGWCIRVFSTDTLGFCQDTSKEDKERAIIQSWEEKEPGRAELAKKSRKRFLLQQKMAKNLELTDDEKNFIKEDRVRKTFNKSPAEEEKENETKNKKGQKGNAQPKKKGKEAPAVEKNDEEKDKENFGYLNVKINYNKKTSKVDHHSSLFIKNFLNYAYDNRMITYNSNFEQENKELNSEVLATEKEEKITAAFLESEKLNSEKMSIKKKDELKLDNKKIFDKIMTHRKKEVEECKSFYNTRTSLAMGIQNKIIVEKKIKDVLTSLGNNDSPTPNETKNKKKNAAQNSGSPDLDEAINIYQEAIKIGLKSNLVEQLFNEISSKKEEIYKNEINKPQDAKNKNKDMKSVATKILNEINNQKWKISDDFLEELNKLKSA